MMRKDERLRFLENRVDNLSRDIEDLEGLVFDMLEELVERDVISPEKVRDIKK